MDDVLVKRQKVSETEKTVGMKTRIKSTLKSIAVNWQLYLIILLPLTYLIVFKYLPMYGLQIAFREYKIKAGFTGGEFVGLKYLIKFFTSFDFKRIFFNTIGLSLYQLVLSFPFPIILALALNYARSKRFKKTAQMLTYVPYFISVVVIVALTQQFLSPRTGIVNQMIVAFGGEPIFFLSKPEYFKSIYVVSTIWQITGYSAIIYLSALSAIPPSLHEAATVDGASKWQRIWHIDIKGITPTIVILLILNVGRIMNIGFEKVLLFQNPLIESSAEIISTYVYKVGLTSSLPNYSYATAIGLFSSVINLVLILTVNQIARKLGESSLW